MRDRRPTFDTVASGYHPGQVDRFVDAVLEGSSGLALDQAARARATELVTQAESQAAEILESARYLKELASQEVETLVRRVHSVAKREAGRILEDARAEASRIVTGARRSTVVVPTPGQPAGGAERSDTRLPIREAAGTSPAIDHTTRVDPMTSVEDLVLDALMRRRSSAVPTLTPNHDDVMHRHLAG